MPSRIGPAPRTVTSRGPRKIGPASLRRSAAPRGHGARRPVAVRSPAIQCLSRRQSDRTSASTAPTPRTRLIISTVKSTASVDSDCDIGAHYFLADFVSYFIDLISLLSLCLCLVSVWWVESLKCAQCVFISRRKKKRGKKKCAFSSGRPVRVAPLSKKSSKNHNEILFSELESWSRLQAKALIYRAIEKSTRPALNPQTRESNQNQINNKKKKKKSEWFL